jgi:hypothetical protein
VGAQDFEAIFRSVGGGGGPWGGKRKSSEPATPDLKVIPPPSATPGTAANVEFGIPRPPPLLLYSPGEQEESSSKNRTMDAYGLFAVPWAAQRQGT